MLDLMLVLMLFIIAANPRGILPGTYELITMCTCGKFRDWHG